MPRLVVNPGTNAAWEIQLKPGTNSLGRNSGNDFQIVDPSISGAHCQIIVDQDSVIVRDLGSTNGTFIDRVPVNEAVLQSGQCVRLGNVDMLFHAETQESTALAASARAGAAAQHAIPKVTASLRSDYSHSTTALPPTPKSAPGMPVPVGAEYCRFHPKMPARFMCDTCRHFFCDACVATRTVAGVPHRFCRHCGAKCVPVAPQFAPEVEKGFFARLPGAFLYPLRGVGVIIVIVGIVLLAMLKLGEACLEYRTLRMIIFGSVMEVFAGGYLFTYLQAIIHSTEAGDRELPELPGISNFLEDVILPFFRLLGLALICFAPTIGLLIAQALNHEANLMMPIIAAVAAGYLYFPMAFLAVATLDSLVAVNPLLVVPSIIKAPLEYLLALVLLGLVFTVQILGGPLLAFLFPEGWTIHSMAGLIGMLALMVFLSFLSLYLLIVAVHVLGLIFVTKKQRLAWFDR